MGGMKACAAERTGEGWSRREFLRTSALAAAAGFGSLSWIGSGEARAAAKPATALTVACRDAHLKATGEPDCWAALKALGASGVEVAVDDKLECGLMFHPERKYSIATPKGVARFEADLQSHGISVTAFCMNNRFDERLDVERAWMKALLPVVQRMGVKAIRLDVVPRAIAKKKFLPFAVKTCRELCEMADAAAPGVRFGIENHGNTTNDPAFLDALFEGVGSARLGLTLDPNNLYWYGHPLEKVYEIIERFSARCFHTHCKNIKYPAAKREETRPMGWEYNKYCGLLADGDIDYRRVLRTLRKGAYAGDLCLEIECLHHFPKEQHPALLKKEIAFLRDLAVA